MSEVNLFELATRTKMRFETKRGNISVEDLWDLPLQSKTGVSLDDTGREIRRTIREREEESLVTTSSTANTELQQKLDIIKHVIAVKQQEADARREAIERKERKQKIQEIIARKQDQELEGKNLEDLQKELESL